MFKNYLRSLTLALAIFSLSGCGIIDMIYLPPAEDTAQEIFEAGNDAMSEKNYVRAVELYNKLRDTYPFSPYTVDAELALADAYYLMMNGATAKHHMISSRCTWRHDAPLTSSIRRVCRS